MRLPSDRRIKGNVHLRVRLNLDGHSISTIGLILYDEMLLRKHGNQRNNVIVEVYFFQTFYESEQ